MVHVDQATFRTLDQPRSHSHEWVGNLAWPSFKKVSSTTWLSVSFNHKIINLVDENDSQTCIKNNNGGKLDRLFDIYVVKHCCRLDLTTSITRCIWYPNLESQLCSEISCFHIYVSATSNTLIHTPIVEIWNCEQTCNILVLEVWNYITLMIKIKKEHLFQTYNEIHAAVPSRLTSWFLA